MSYVEIIKNKLENAFTGAEIEVIDESHQHEGHAGSKPGGETHFAVSIISEKFSGKNRVARQREVFGALKYELETQIHALRFIRLDPPT